MDALFVLLIALLAIGLSAFFYFLPAFIAFRREHHNRMAILVLNLLLGWTFLGWVGALIWSLTAVRYSRDSA